MKNSELLLTKHQDLLPVDKQRRYVLRSLVQKNACPNCGRLLNFFEGAGIDIDDWEDEPGGTSFRCTACGRGLVYVVPIVAAGNGGWLWHLVPVKSP